MKLLRFSRLGAPAFLLQQCSGSKALCEHSPLPCAFSSSATTRDMGGVWDPLLPAARLQLHTNPSTLHLLACCLCSTLSHLPPREPNPPTSLSFHAQVASVSAHGATNHSVFFWCLFSTTKKGFQVTLSNPFNAN